MSFFDMFWGTYVLILALVLAVRIWIPSTSPHVKLFRTVLLSMSFTGMIVALLQAIRLFF